MLTGGRTPGSSLYPPNFSVRGNKRTHANTVYPDHMPQIAASDQDLHCLYKIHEFLKTK